MQCPSCQTTMHERYGPYGAFLFCPNQAICKQKTLKANPAPVKQHSERTDYGSGDNFESFDYGAGVFGPDEGMARMAYENDREHEHTRDRSSVDASMVLWGGGMFCDMGMEDDDEDQRPW